MGDLSGNATSASKAPWSGITGKPDSMPASDVFPWAKEATKPTYTYIEVGAAPLEHNHDDLYYTEAEITAFLNKKANIEHNHDSVYYTQTKINELLLQKSDLGHKHAKGDVGLSNVDNTADKDKVVKSAASADAVAWINVLNKPDSYIPSAHKHKITDISDLKATLEGKSDVGHTHTKEDVGLSNVDNTADKDKVVKSAKSADSVIWAFSEVSLRYIFFLQ